MRRLLLPAVTTIAMLALTLSLGVWQIGRLHWKEALLSEIDRGESMPPVPLSDRPVPFTRVIAEGQFTPLLARYGAAVRPTPSGAAMGADVLGLLQGAQGLPVLVDRGWAPVDWAAPIPAGPVQIVGYVRPSEAPAWTAPTDDASAGRFFTLNPAGIAAALGVNQVAAFTVVALGSGDTYPIPAAALPRPPNDHLSYAITWFSLSAVLLGVFAAFVRQTLQTGRRP